MAFSDGETARVPSTTVGSNDGLLLQEFQARGMQVIGVEPAENIVQIARERGVDTIADYFSRGSVDAILALKGKAAVVTANNVFAHTGDIDGFLDNAKRLLAEAGVLVIEVQYLLDTLRNLTFDNIYHERRARGPASRQRAHPGLEFRRRDPAQPPGASGCRYTLHRAAPGTANRLVTLPAAAGW